MSANLHLDYGNTLYFTPSIVLPSNTAGSGITTVGQWCDLSNTDAYCGIYITLAGGCSGPVPIAVQTAPGNNDIGFLGSGAVSGCLFSGASPASGMFRDPTSGLSQLPTWFSSGGILWVNSGLYTVPGGATTSGVSVPIAAQGGSVLTFGLVNGYPAYTLPFGTRPIQNAQGGNSIILSGAWPVMASGGVAYANFQRDFKFARLVLLSGATLIPALNAGFISQLMTTGSGQGSDNRPEPNLGINV